LRSSICGFAIPTVPMRFFISGCMARLSLCRVNRRALARRIGRIA
jgi:hypothetical protein